MSSRRSPAARLRPLPNRNQASVGDPTRVAADAAGNVYFTSLHSVFKVDPTGTLTRFAGNGRAGNSGDGGPATSAQLNFPMGIAIDGADNVFVADRDASVVRKIAANGIITTVAGTGTAGFSGDSGPAARHAAQRPLRRGASTPPAISTSPTPAMRRFARSPPTARSPPYAGTGTAAIMGDGGAARSAWLNGPEGVAVDCAGNLYIADTFNGRIRRVSTDGTITTVAGSGTTGIFSGDGGPATGAALAPTDVAVDRAGNLYIADFGNSRIRQVTNGVITTVVGHPNGAPMIDGEAAVNARLEGPTGVAIDRNGIIYFVEAGIGSGTGLARGDYKVWKVSSAGVLTTFAGNGIPNYSGDGGRPRPLSSTVPPESHSPVRHDLHCRHTEPAGTRDRAGRRRRHVAGTGIGRLQRRDRIAAHGAAQPSATAWRPTPRATGTSPTPPTIAFARCSPAAICSPSRATAMRAISATAAQATRASVNHPEGVAVDAAGNVYIADTLDNAVRKVTPDGVITTIAGTGTSGYSGDGGPATQARLNRPRAVAVDAAATCTWPTPGTIRSAASIRRAHHHRGHRRLAHRTARSGGGSRGQSLHRRYRQPASRRVSPGTPITTIAG